MKENLYKHIYYIYSTHSIQIAEPYFSNKKNLKLNFSIFKSAVDKLNLHLVLHKGQ